MHPLFCKDHGANVYKPLPVAHVHEDDLVVGAVVESYVLMVLCVAMDSVKDLGDNLQPSKRVCKFDHLKT